MTIKAYVNLNGFFEIKTLILRLHYTCKIGVNLSFFTV